MDPHRFVIATNGVCLGLSDMMITWGLPLDILLFLNLNAVLIFWNIISTRRENVGQVLAPVTLLLVF